MKKSLDHLACHKKFDYERKCQNLVWVGIHGAIYIPQTLGGTELLNMEDHMVDQKLKPLKGMCICTQPWAKINYILWKMWVYTSNGYDFGSNRTEPLSHGLMVYWFQIIIMVWFGLDFQ